MKRKIVKIDETKCNGCGLCVPSCHEGAIQIIDGKARLVSESYCDGLGNCLGECPMDAITLEEREAEEFDAEAVKARMEKAQALKSAKSGGSPCGCPGAAAFAFSHERDLTAGNDTASQPSALRQWPVQLHLVPVDAPYWTDADLLIAADCVATAYGDFHRDLLRDKKLVIACPKLDDTGIYVEKLRSILASNSIRSLTVAFMEVPCCAGIVRIAQEALRLSERDIPLELVRIGIRGDKTSL